MKVKFAQIEKYSVKHKMAYMKETLFKNYYV